MKALFPLLLCLLLCSCAWDDTPPETEPSSAEAVLPAVHAQITPVLEALAGHPLSVRKVRDLCALDTGLLAFSGQGSTTLTLLSRESLIPIAQHPLGFPLEPEDASVQFHAGSLSFFDPMRQETLVLNSKTLSETAAIPLPPNGIGSPILSSDETTLYYCTPDSLQAWNRKTDIHRTVKEMTCTEQTLAGLYLKDSVLKCRSEDGRTIFLSANTGQLLAERDGNIALSATDNGRFYGNFEDGFQRISLFGIAGGTPSILLPAPDTQAVFFLPELHAAVCSAPSGEETLLTCFDLESGNNRGSFTLPPLQTPKALVSGSDDTVYILTYDPALDCDLISCWQLSAAQDSGSRLLSEVYVSPDNSDPGALAACSTLAAELESKYGLEILIGNDALELQPWDYRFCPEIQPGLLMQALTQTDRLLSVFPEDILQQTAAHFSGLKLCLVRSITGTGQTGPGIATGVQFLDGSDAIISIATGRYFHQSLYHELFHVMETHIFGGSTALDQWENLNPRSFSYGMTSESYLTGEGRAFVDLYSMHSPREDRARIFENAMLPENAALFRPAIMQKKLKQICLGIREAYGLGSTQQVYPWEQYLAIPLTT